MLWFQKYLLGHRALEKQGQVKQNIWSSYLVIMHTLQAEVSIMSTMTYYYLNWIFME
jgi:hypothetical protein